MESQSFKYILVDKKPVPVSDVIRWAKWYENFDNRTLEQEEIITKKGIRVFVSTVFLGLDHRFSSLFGANEKPILFETMIFGGKHDQYQARYSTWDEAMEGHKVALEMAREE